MLLKTCDLQAIKAGKIDLVFRRWKRPTIEAGSTLNTPIGVLSISAVTAVAEGKITKAEARRAGFERLAELHARLAETKDAQVYRIELTFAGPDPRVALRRSKLGHDELAMLRKRLASMDSRAEAPWTDVVLRVIADNPGKRARDLAASLGLEMAAFKLRVRRLKALGLTESLETGYRLSPRGRAAII